MEERIDWFDRKFHFGLAPGMLPLLFERLQGTVWRMENKVKGVRDHTLSEKPGGKWSVKQHIGHLAEVDQINNKRIDEILGGAPTMSPAVFEPQDYSTWPVANVIAFFNETRQSNLAKYAGLTTKEMMLTSVHPRLKVAMNPVDLAFFDAEHDDHHLLKITDILKASR